MGDTGPEHEIEVVPETTPWREAPVAPPIPSRPVTPAPEREPAREPVPV